MKRTYRISGLDCAACAQGFEKDLAALPGLGEVRVNYLAASLIFHGELAEDKLQKIAAAHGVTVQLQPALGQPEGEGAESRGQKNRIYIEVALSGLLLLIYVIGSWQGQSWPWLLPIAAVLGGGRNFVKGLRNLLRLSFNTDVLMFLAVIGAFAIDQWQEGALVAFLFGISEILERFTAARARKSIGKLVDSKPQRAVLLTEEGERDIPAAEVEPGQRLLLRAGEKVPVDALVLTGHSFIQQAHITGEHLPREVAPGDTLYSGSLNQQGVLEIEALRKAEDSTMSKIVALVEEAQGRRSRFQGMVERFAAIYTPCVLVLAILISLLPPLLTGAAWIPWIYRGLTLLVISCPCALVVTSPVVLVSAITNGARHGILIKGGNYLEALAGVKIAAFDKTGTLSQGRPEVAEMQTWQMEPEEALALAAGLGNSSSHPLSLALSREAESRGIQEAAFSSLQNLPGRGNQGLLDGRKWLLGNQRLFPQLAPEMAAQWQEWAEQGYTVSALGSEGAGQALFAFRDSPRPQAAPLLKELHRLGIEKTVILSGDTPEAVQAFAAKCGADEAVGGLLPGDKVAEIARLQQQGPVLMVGDGINDAPALAAADISAAMGAAGSAAALEAADIALMNDDLSKLSYGIALSQKAVATIKQNIAFALGLKLLVLFAIFPGWLSLWLAILSDMGANILVTLNGMKLLLFHKEQGERPPKAE